MTTFQPRPGDACTWVAEAVFYDFDDELEEQDLSLQDLQTGYDILHKAFTEASISFAAIGGFVFSILGAAAREEGFTQDEVVFQINSTPVELFTKLRTMKKLRLKIGLQADIFRVHCNIGADKWIGVNMLMTKKNLNEISREYKGVRMLNITPLLQTKLMNFAARTASGDASDIMYLVEIHTTAIDASQLDQAQVDYFLENAELETKAREAVRRVLKR